MYESFDNFAMKISVWKKNCQSTPETDFFTDQQKLSKEKITNI